MMRPALILSVALSFGLVGCTLHPANLVGLPSTGAAAPEVTGSTLPAAQPQQAPVAQYGTLQLTVKWPEQPTGYNVALLPTTTNSLIVKIKDGATVVGQKTITREAGAPSATAAFSLKAANNLAIEVKAYRETSPVDGVSDPIARGSGNANIVPSKKSSANLQLTPVYVPTITGLSTNTGITGDTFTVTGTNFASGSVPVYVEVNGYRGVVKSRTETSLTVELPMGVPTGKVVVLVDGVKSTDDWNFWVPNTVSISDGGKPGWDPSADASTRIVLLGKTRQFSASTTWVTRSGDSLGNYGTPPQPLWNSSNGTAGSIDASGVFTAASSYVPAGTNVTASFGSNASNAIKVIPEDVAVSLVKPAGQLMMGGKGLAELRVGGVNTFSDGATNSLFAWDVSDPASMSVTDGWLKTLDFGNTGSILLTATSATDASKMATASISLENYRVTTFAGRGLAGFADGAADVAKFNGPYGLAFDQSGNLLVADSNNYKVRRIASDGTVSTWASADSPYLRGLVVDSQNYLWASNWTSVQKYHPMGTILMTVGAYSAQSDFIDGNASTARFSATVGLAIDGNDNLYVADRDNNVIRKVDPTGNVSTFAGTGEAGGDNGPRGQATFKTPYAVATDGNGNVYVGDVGDWARVRKISASGEVSTLVTATWPDNYFSQVFAIAVDNAGRVFIADSTGICRIENGKAIRVAGTTDSGSANGIGTKARFNYPLGLAFGPDGALYVADQNNNKIRKLD